MLPDIFRKLFGPYGDTNRGDNGDSSSIEQFGASGLPRSIEDDLRRQYIDPDEDLGQDFPVMHSFDDNQSMDRMFNEMEELFRGLLGNSGFGTTFSVPYNGEDMLQGHTMEDEHHSGTDLRGRMLREPDDHKPNDWFAPGLFQRPTPFAYTPDKDLDDDMSRGNIDIDSLLPNEDSTRQPSVFSQPRTGSSAAFKFSSVTTTRKADGTVERKTTVKDSEGNEEVSITRTIGDRTLYTVKRGPVKRKVDPSGSEETAEEFVNMDEGDSKQFGDTWSALQNQGRPAILFGQPTTDDQYAGHGIYESIKHFFKL